MVEIVVVACPPGELAELLDPDPDETPEDRQLEFCDVWPVQRGPDLGAATGGNEPFFICSRVRNRWRMSFGTRPQILWTSLCSLAGPMIQNPNIRLSSNISVFSALSKRLITSSSTSP